MQNFVLCCCVSLSICYFMELSASFFNVLSPNHFKKKCWKFHNWTKLLQSQLHDFKQAQNSENSQLHQTLIDPAVNLVFERMKAQLSDYKEKLDQAQSDLSAWKFTPDRLAGQRKHTLENLACIRQNTSNPVIVELIVHCCICVHVHCMCVCNDRTANMCLWTWSTLYVYSSMCMKTFILYMYMYM